MKIHHVALRTRDLGALRAFYRDVLGLAVLRERPGESVWLDAGGSIVMLERAGDGEPRVDPTTRDLLAFTVAPSDLATLEAALTSHNVAIEARTEFTLYFRDPDGRRVGLSHYPEHARHDP